MSSEEVEIAQAKKKGTTSYCFVDEEAFTKSKDLY